MGNRYEFKAEEIDKVAIISIGSEYRYDTFYTRKMDEDGNPTRLFITNWDSDPDIDGDKVKCICKRCERWNTFNIEEWKSPEFNSNLCNYCEEDYEDIISEEDLIELVLSYMDKDLFFVVNLYINDILIK